MAHPSLSSLLQNFCPYTQTMLSQLFSEPPRGKKGKEKSSDDINQAACSQKNSFWGCARKLCKSLSFSPVSASPLCAVGLLGSIGAFKTSMISISTKNADDAKELKSCQKIPGCIWINSTQLTQMPFFSSEFRKSDDTFRAAAQIGFMPMSQDKPIKPATRKRKRGLFP